MTETVEAMGAALAGRITGDVRVDVFNRIAYSTDAGIYRILPQCVVMPRSEADIVATVQYAAQNGIPIAPRGAGSGVAGESLTGGIVLDVRQYMTQILETAEDGAWVRVQPGVVLDDLNRHLAKWGRKIGPDPSSGNRAVTGGIVANNATGAHSLQYGFISEHVETLRTVLADGTVCSFGSDMRPDECPEPHTRRMVQGCLELLGPNQRLIEQSQPATKRNRCAYTLNGVICQDAVNMARLLTGSEGTLGIFTEITLRTVPLAAAQGLVQFEFATFEKMAQAVPIIVECGADACELMDRTLATMARDALPQYRDILPADCEATLLVEHCGPDLDTVRQKIEATTQAVAALSSRAMTVLDARRQATLWKSRKDAVPLLNRGGGDAHPLAFVEDVSVDHRRLDAYIAGLEQIGRRYNFPMAFYGHAGDGELHIRPYLDVRKSEDLAAMRNIAEDVFTLAWSLGGSISGEHGDGLLRAAYVRRQYGDAYYELLKRVKQLFDPHSILNPGKIISDDAEVMTQHLRVDALAAATPFEPELHREPEAFRLEVEQCNGCGVCLATAPGARMCPVFRGTGRELATSRAKANLIGAWMAAEKAGQPLDDSQLKQQLALCVNCKMCSVECPAGVDVSRLVIEARAQLAKHTGFTTAELTLIHNHWLSIAAGTFAPLSNWVMGLGPTRWLLEKTIGLDRNRSLPHFERGSFVRKAQALLARTNPAEPLDHAAYFVDSFANYNDHALGRAVVGVLQKAGVKVAVPKQRPAPMPAFVYGDIKRTRKDVAYTLRQLGPYAAMGYRVVCSEPSAALCLGQEIDLIDDSPAAGKVSRQTVELMGYLDELLTTHPQVRQRLKTPAAAFGNKRIAYHTPCHLRPMRDADLTPRLLKDLCDLEVHDLNAGCCGLAGTAGMQAKNRSLSTSISRCLKDAIDHYRPDIILTECAACKMQIETLTSAPVLHPISILAQNT